MSTTTEHHVTPACMFCGRTSVVELTSDEAAALRAGAPIQDAAPNRPAPERELIRSGIHPACWADAFGTVDDDE
ncbi:hypothetical protein [uncultured Microbacterium sp.]|uniref:hypothetical protein n=1 Tax=uncultured Microbacterium sp. TaxID=191216 RepID=UPI00259358BE|nr:hypothetical protein [uncultured Microbacterium sp.]